MTDEGPPGTVPTPGAPHLTVLHGEGPDRAGRDRDEAVVEALLGPVRRSTRRWGSLGHRFRPRPVPFGTSDVAWLRGAAFTLGAEDELVLVDDDGRLLGERAIEVRERLCRSDPGCAGSVKGEVYLDQLELNAPACADGDELARAVGALRHSISAKGVRAMAVAVHPTARLGDVAVASSPRYDVVLDELGGLLRTPTSAFRVHVALPDEHTAITAYRGLRHRLSLLRALSVASPFWHGRDSGLASSRSALLRSYPRVGVPPVLGTWEDFLLVTDRIVRSAGVPDASHVWWDLRPQPRLGTLEVRVMDTQPDVARLAGLATLVQGLARHAVEVPVCHDLPDDVLAANDYRACRHGLATTVVDVDGRVHSLRDVATRALADARAALAPEGLDRPLDVVEEMLATPSEADHHRRLHREQGMDALLTDLVDRTVSQAR